jgi:hypothetical protein
VTHAYAHLLVPVVRARTIHVYVAYSFSFSPFQHTSLNTATPADNSPDLNTMEPLRVQTQLKSRYTVFDASGRLPFDIVFGLRRRSDSDPRDISFQITKSFLDVPYALANGLLSLHELRPSNTGSNEHIEVDISRVRNAVRDDEPVLEHITLPSKSNRMAERGQMGVTEYRYRVDSGSPLASIFELGKKYSIRLANKDLSIHRWIDSDQALSSNADTTPSSTSECGIETCKLVSNPHGGFAVFTVVENLVWPPTVKTQMSLLYPRTNESPNSGNLDQPLLQVTATNTGSDLISIQTRGQQRFLSPWGPFQPESDDGLNAGRMPCILDPSSTTGNLQVIDVATGSIVRDSRKPGVCGLTSGKPDTRPKVDELLVLKPGVPFSREIELDACMHGLEDGRYLIRLKPKGCWWHFGVIESEPDDDSKVPKRLMSAKQTPVVLESVDQVKFEMSNGRISKAG